MALAQSALIVQAASAIHHNAKAQAQLINNHLDLSRLQTGKLQVERCPLNFTPVMSDALESIRHEMTQKALKRCGWNWILRPTN